MLYSSSSLALGSPFRSTNLTVRPDFTANTLSSSRYLEVSSKICVVTGLNPSAKIYTRLRQLPVTENLVGYTKRMQLVKAG